MCNDCANLSHVEPSLERPSLVYRPMCTMDSSDDKVEVTTSGQHIPKFVPRVDWWFWECSVQCGFFKGQHSKRVRPEIPEGPKFSCVSNTILSGVNRWVELSRNKKSLPSNVYADDNLSLGVKSGVPIVPSSLSYRPSSIDIKTIVLMSMPVDLQGWMISTPSHRAWLITWEIVLIVYKIHFLKIASLVLTLDPMIFPIVILSLGAYRVLKSGSFLSREGKLMHGPAMSLPLDCLSLRVTRPLITREELKLHFALLSELRTPSGMTVALHQGGY